MAPAVGEATGDPPFSLAASSRTHTWTAPAALFALSAVASAALLLALGSKLSFFLDDWTFLIYRNDFGADAVLAPHGENIAVGLVLVYKGLLETVGMSSAFPFRVVATGLFIASVCLLFVMVRRRVGDWAALILTAPVLFLGAAWEDLLWPFQIGYFTSVAAGLAALILMARDNRRDDLVACALLIVSLAFSSVGIPFLAGAAALIAARHEIRRRAYVVLLPGALFALWWLTWGSDAESAISARTIATSPWFLIEGLASTISSLLGLATPRTFLAVDPVLAGLPLLAALVLFASWRLRSQHDVSPWLVAFVAITAVFWLLAGVNEKPGRDPTASRYQYLGAVFLILIVAELLRGTRLSARTLAVSGGIMVMAVASNVHFLSRAADTYRQITEQERAGLAAIEATRGVVGAGFTLTPELVGTGYVHIEAGPYLSAVDAFGSPAYSPEEVTQASEPARVAADRVVASALGIRVLPAAAPVESEQRCERLGGRNEPAELVAAPPGISLTADPSVRVLLGRYASSPSVDLGALPARNVVIPIRSDDLGGAWKIRLDPGASGLVCPLAQDT